MQLHHLLRHAAIAGDDAQLLQHIACLGVHGLTTAGVSEGMQMQR
jgi:hypothetical protein